MRIAIVAAFMLVLAACGAPTATETPATAPEDASAGSTGVGAVASEPFTLETEAVVGQWSFDRTCGLYDLVFTADANVSYYDYSNEAAVVSYGGEWTENLADKRVVLTLHRLDAEGHYSGEPITYNLDITAPPTEDLIGRFARGDGADARDITARRCPEEDRD